MYEWIWKKKKLKIGQVWTPIMIYVKYVVFPDETNENFGKTSKKQTP